MPGRPGAMLGRVSLSDASRTPTRDRREPPRYRHVVGRRVRELTPRMVRVTHAGAELEGFALEDPGASGSGMRVLKSEDAMTVTPQ